MTYFHHGHWHTHYNDILSSSFSIVILLYLYFCTYWMIIEKQVYFVEWPFCPLHANAFWGQNGQGNALFTPSTTKSAVCVLFIVLCIFRKILFPQCFFYFVERLDPFCPTHLTSMWSQGAFVLYSFPKQTKDGVYCSIIRKIFSDVSLHWFLRVCGFSSWFLALSFWFVIL